MTTHAFVFPGQGSQSVGMLAELASSFPIVQQTFEEASEVLGYDLWTLSQQGPEEDLNKTDRTQPALLAAGIAVWRVWCAQGGAQPALMAGHSFGEYSALVAAEAMSFTDGISLAQARGQFMQSAVPVGVGAVAAILGLSDEAVITACDSAAQGEIVSAVNFNAPSQVVIAGHKEAVERSIVTAQEAGAKKAVLLPISVPVHCALMQPAAENMAARLEDFNFNIPRIPVLHNVDISAKTAAADIRAALASQINSPVRWVATIEKMRESGIETIVECGPGKVLTGLNKRIARRMPAFPVNDNASLEKAFTALEETA